MSTELLTSLGTSATALSRPRVLDFLAAGLGDRSYLVIEGDRAVMIDPQRDIEPYLEMAERHGAAVTHVLETHVHNDYISGGPELARRSDATLVLPAGSGAAYRHREAPDGAILDAGGLQVHALHTPGHTLEHTSYLLRDGRGSSLLFSGGSLLSGSAGRTDLAGAALTDRLTAHQFSSVRRLADLDPDTILFPTHGAGSFCTASGPMGSGFSTIGHECRTNPALVDAEPMAFARRQLDGLLRYPAYYAGMAPINRAGPKPLGTLIAPPAITPTQLAAFRAAGIAVVDGRPRAAFAASHVPGAINIELDDSFATYVGWLLPVDAPLALVLDPGQDALEAVRQLARIGFDGVRGVLRGLDGWASAGRPTGRFLRAGIAGLRAALDSPTPPRVLDVRQPAEWRNGVITGSDPTVRRRPGGCRGLAARRPSRLGGLREWVPRLDRREHPGLERLRGRRRGRWRRAGHAACELTGARSRHRVARQFEPRAPGATSPRAPWSRRRSQSERRHSWRPDGRGHPGPQRRSMPNQPRP